MKRVICVAALLVVCLPASALAGTKQFNGNFNGGGTIKFKAHLRNGTPTKISVLRWKHLPMDCAVGGTAPYNGGFGFPVTVARRHFNTRGQTPDGNIRSKFEGRFVKHGKQAKGYLKIDGSFPDNGFSGCHSGKARFKAK